MIILLVILPQIYMPTKCRIITILLALRMHAILIDVNNKTGLFDFDAVHFSVLQWSWIKCRAQVSHIAIYDKLLITAGIAYGNG